MKSKGQVAVYMVMLGVVIIILALALIPIVKQSNETAMGQSSADFTGLDCNNSSISDYQKAQCVATDMSLPYFTFALIGIGGAVLVARLIVGGSQ